MPDEVKYNIKMCERLAVSDWGLSYKEEVEKSIVSFLKKRLNFDYMGGNRELNLNLAIHEAESLFNANDKIKEMAASGELAAFHKKCAELDDAVSAGYLKTMDQLDRTLNQINETEDEIYEGLRDSKDLDRLRLHSD
jgi:hypothetical protein